MEPVTANYNLIGYAEKEQRVVAPADIYKVLLSWRDADMFNSDHIGAMSRQIARHVNDLYEERSETGDKEVLYFNYDPNFGNSYKQADILTERFGEHLISLDEMRDSGGILRQWRVIAFKKEDMS